MTTNFDFFRTTMPESRKADFYLGCLDSSVFMDFNLSEGNRIYLRRISFDGYGCCNIVDVIYASKELSNKFLKEINEIKLNQAELAKIVKELIKLNEKSIWEDALEEYGLIEV